MLTITRQYEFEAAHFIPNHTGKCRYLHGHSYKLSVTLGGELCKDNTNKNPRFGMILDFKELDNIIKSIVKHDEENIDKGLDHNLLNNVFEYPTAEIMVNLISIDIATALEKFCKEENIKRRIWVERVDLWETSKSYASWVRDK